MSAHHTFLRAFPFFFAATLLIASGGSALADPPQLIRYQGVLTDDAGVVLDGAPTRSR